MAENKIDYSKLIRAFDTDDEAIDFVKKYVDSLLLTYIPENEARYIRIDAKGYVIFDIYLKKVALHTNDIRNAVDAYAGAELLSYMEWKTKQELL